MAILHMDGFDRYASIADAAPFGGYSYTGSWGLQTAGSQWGGGAILPPNTNSTWFRRLITGAPAELWTAFWLKYGSPVNVNYALASFESAGGVLENLVTLNTSSLEVRGYRGTSLIGSAVSAVALLPGVWYWIEVRSVLHDSAGVLEAWVDGTRVLNLTGVDTKPGSAAAYASVCLGASAVSQGPGSNNIVYDDWIILDTTGSANNARPGKRRIRTLYPIADAGPNDGTPSTGSDHYAVVDEPQVSTTDYLTLTNTAGQTEMFGMDDLSAAPLAINGIKVSAVVSTDDGGAAEGRMVVDSAGTEAEGPVANVTAGYTAITGLWETDPATAAAWTKAGVDGLKAGYKVA